MLTRTDMALYIYSRYQRPAKLANFPLTDTEDGIGPVIDNVLRRLKVKKADWAQVVLSDSKENAAYRLLDFYVCVALLTLLAESKTEVVQTSAVFVKMGTSARAAAALGYPIPAKERPDLSAPESTPDG